MKNEEGKDRSIDRSNWSDPAITGRTARPGLGFLLGFRNHLLLTLLPKCSGFGENVVFRSPNKVTHDILYSMGYKASKVHFGFGR